VARIGVYIAAGPNPLFLRFCMLQLAAQTVQPDHVAIHENGFANCAWPWCFQDGGFHHVLYKHTPTQLDLVKRYSEALRLLVEETDTDVFVKMDTDDFFYKEHLEYLVSIRGENDWACNSNNACVLIRPKEKNFVYSNHAPLAFNPVGAASDNVVFNRKFAEAYLAKMDSYKHMVKCHLADDQVMRDVLNTGAFKIARVSGPATYCYVSHGDNQSTAAWQVRMPAFLHNAVSKR
jgi:hypothetical protein